jgi:hypothetical protein
MVIVGRLSAQTRVDLQAMSLRKILLYIFASPGTLWADIGPSVIPRIPGFVVERHTRAGNAGSLTTGEDAC